MRHFHKINLLNTLVVMVLFGLHSLQANNRIDSILESSENIKIISQSLAKNYFYINQGIQTSSAKRGLKKDIFNLDRSIKTIESNAKDQETKDLIQFTQFSVEELKAILKEPYTPENGGLILDYTEALLESSDTIMKHHMAKNPDKNVEMLLMVVDMKYLLARAAKYYIAFSAGFTDAVNVSQANIAVDEFGKLLAKVEAYGYPPAISKKVIRKLSRYWPSSKSFYRGIKKSELPTIIFISTKHMERSINQLITYHKNIVNK